MNNPLRHINRHRQMVALLYKYWHSDQILNSGLADQIQPASYKTVSISDTGKRFSHDWSDRDAPAKEPIDNENAGPEQLASDLEAMGPAFIKLGQLLSTRTDLLPDTYCEALSRLQDNVTPIPPREVFRTIEVELGEQPEYLFSSFDHQPLATASLGQVHRALLKNGENVVVKVQRPGILVELQNDIEAMEDLVTVCEAMGFARKYQLKHLVKSLKDSLAMELNYEREATNAEELKRNLAQFSNIVIPQPIKSLSSKSVITMQYVDFQKLTELPKGRLSNRHREKLAAEIFKSFLYQVLVFGSFHADPHPGNMGLTKDDRLAWIDHGLVVDVSPDLQASLIKLLLAITEGEGIQAAKIAEKAGIQGNHYQSDKFKHAIQNIVSRNIDRNLSQMATGSALMEIQRAAGDNDLWLPQTVILLGRAMMHLESVVIALDENFDPNRAIEKHAMQILREYSGQKLSLNSLYQSFLESTEFVQRLPARANQLSEMITNNGLEFKVRAFDETKFISGLNKVANRISTGLIISAMIIAAALMMRLQSDWTILGYPGIAFLLFSFAAIAGGALVWRVLVSDRFES